MQLRFWFAVLAVTLGAVGLALDFHVISGTMTASPDNPVPRSFGSTLIYFWSFLTHLANLGLVLVYLADLTGWRVLGWFRHPVTVTGMAGVAALVMLYFHFMLSPLYQFSGALLYANYILHYVAPILFLTWWLAFVRHGTLRLSDLPAMLVPGLVYVAYVLIRGAIVAEYPYTILDPTFVVPGRGPNGYVGVAIGVGILVLLVAVFDVVLILVDGFLGRRRQLA